MVSRVQILSAVLAYAALSAPALGSVCDYRLSQLVGNFGASAAIGASGAVAATGPAMQATGLYLITNYTTGLVMIGSTAAGASAAGTVGIIAGTHGILGSAAAIASAPLAAIAAGAAAIGAGGLEAACYFRDERITDIDEILQVMQVLATVMPSSAFILDWRGVGGRASTIWVRLEAGEPMQRYLVEDLYIVNGRLIHRDWGPNTVVGDIQGFMGRVEAGGPAVELSAASSR